MWKSVRVTVLLLILAYVAFDRWREHARLDWQEPFVVGLYPINADHSERVDRYLLTLDSHDFMPLEAFFAQQAEAYGLPLNRPFIVKLGARVYLMPPAPPGSAEIWDIVQWSLAFRWYAWRHTPFGRLEPNVRLFLLYHDPAITTHLSHSTALDKGRIGRINVFGDVTQHEQNLVVIAHELLHTVRASDKYDFATNQPLEPAGLADPSQIPLYPQHQAELMAGRIPISHTQAIMPGSLSDTVIGNMTALEIGWLKP